MRVVQLGTSWALMMPTVSEYLLRALDRMDDQWEGGAAAAFAWLHDNADDPCVAILLALDDQTNPVGVTVISDQGVYPFSPHPWILYLHAEGEREAKDALALALCDWARSRGHKVMLAHNHSPISDDDFLATFRDAAKGRVRASLLEFEVSE